MLQKFLHLSPIHPSTHPPIHPSTPHSPLPTPHSLKSIYIKFKHHKVVLPKFADVSGNPSVGSGTFYGRGQA
ncbi:MAG: hypothetical protein MUF49_22095 [Oculatellaceae cyanobacterium Prado106]|nr:hypothetical protein [Oculatellaceae cyanobacterium Prado106]